MKGNQYLPGFITVKLFFSLLDKMFSRIRPLALCMTNYTVIELVSMYLFVLL